uniref:Uncharacterized protein n=1 Tax=Glossina austeni TaxID=7395 RepID=A0A1A9UWU6_GLOAU
MDRKDLLHLRPYPGAYLSTTEETTIQINNGYKWEKYTLTCLTLSKTTLLGSFIISVILGSVLVNSVVAMFACGVEDPATAAGGGGKNTSRSCIMRPPRLEVFSTCNAMDIPCSCLPSPWPSLKPYLAIILAATELAE